jgi:hypothetical protein
MNNRKTLSTQTTSQPLNTAVLFIVFNRPETTIQVFEAIRKARPTRLYIAADGPRENVPGEGEKCEEVKQIATAVDWVCEVRTLFRDTNLGCGQGPCTAITWFFEHESEGIILEDDCLPSPSFFPFCEELLVKYRDDTRVMEIGGNNLEEEVNREDEYSFGFSNHIYIWGWATWKRAWKFHDFYMNHYKEIKEKGYLHESFDSIYERDFYQYVFEKMYKGDARTNSQSIWDYQWQFACKINSGLVIVPNRNLVINLGFGQHATNTLNPAGVGHDLKLEAMEFPIKYPEFMMSNNLRDRQVFREVSTSSLSRVKSHIKNFIPARVLEKVVKPLMSILS